MTAGETSKRPTCLCVKEGHPGLQKTGHFKGGTFVVTGVSVCHICDGSAISPRAMAEFKRLGVKPEPSEPPMTLEELEAEAGRLLEELENDPELAALVGEEP